ncbi:hypothetical protein G7Y89_g4861 [Cudoniella acicularis]|uniref:Nuclear RNA binding protein n=1 Tax=Cudoniella acicularis TaxID=354080 RepID=A0A8H4W3W7_9HELO|nr:hypothetical protein G7Y89_g4861 [Cudoniella acicularis]
MASRSAYPRNSRRESLDDSPEVALKYIDTSAKGAKRLFSNRHSRLSANAEDYGENYEVADYEEESHSEKRHRTSDWPLSNTTPASAAPARRPLRNRNAPNSPTFRRRSSSQARPSKFVEGSMNDRVSQMPPPPYLGIDDGFQDRYEHDNGRHIRGRKMAQPRKFTHYQDDLMTEGSVADRSEASSRHSSIFRFGKSIASTFNPSNWKIWSKPQPIIYDEETTQQRILRERQEKAEKIYKELKQSGHFRGTAVNVTHLQEVERKKSYSGKHDSGIEFDDESVSRIRRSADIPNEQKRMGRVFLESSDRRNSYRGESPASNYSASVMRSNPPSPSRRSFDLKRASLTNIKKAFVGDNSDGYHQARRIPSRKDLQKQQKLVKRVSDLEGKLEAARRQLSDALGEPIPSQPPPRVGRSRFVPGALSTLPSERLLSGYVDPEAGFSDEETNPIGKAVTVDDSSKDAPNMAMDGLRGSYGEKANTKMRETADWSEKSLPIPPNDEVIQSVEKDDDMDETIEYGARQSEDAETEAQEGTLNESSALPSANDSSYEEEQSDKESTPKPKTQPSEITPKKDSTPRKRKSRFERLADDGRYKPSPEPDSDDESEVKKATLRKKPATSRPRKLQKVTQDTAKVANAPKLKGSTLAPPKNTHTGTKITVFDMTSKTTGRGHSRTGAVSSAKLVKSKPQPNARQSVSPPPSSDFNGLDYMKPSLTSKSVKIPKSGNQLGAEDVAYIANPAFSSDVPPMPKMPKAVRLASGEMISTAPSLISGNSRQSSPSKLTKPNPTIKEGESTKPDKDNVQKPLTRAHESFEWPPDVF